MKVQGSCHCGQINCNRAMVLTCEFQNSCPRRPILWPAVYEEDRRILLAAVFNHVHGSPRNLQMRVPDHPAPSNDSRSGAQGACIDPACRTALTPDGGA